MKIKLTIDNCNKNMDFISLPHRQNISVPLSFDEICRTCLSSLKTREKRVINSIFSETIKEKFFNLTTFQINEDDGLPKFICTHCLELLNSAYMFKKKIEVSEQKLKKQLEMSSETSYIDDGLINDSDCGEFIKLESTIKEEYKDFQCNADDVKTQDNTDDEDLQNEIFLISKTEKKLNQCEDCGKVYSNVYDLIVHCRSHNGIKPHLCKICNKTFADPRCLKKHERIHTGIKPHKCNICGKCFITNQALLCHVKRHNGERSILCAACGQLFCTAAELNVHNLRHHSPEKPYKCSLCPKAFPTKSNLLSHEIIHSGQDVKKEKKIVCSICNKKWRDNGDLRTHMRSHTGEKPFKCKFPNCTKTFKTNSHMNNHLRSHTDERNHTCSICSSKFRSHYQLKVHMRVHTGEKPYICSYCGHCFSQNGALHTHLKIHKRDNIVNS